MKQSIQTKNEAWLHAVRLRTLPLALASIFAGSFLAYEQGVFRWSILALASLTTIFLQILSNLSNDYGDTIHGADHADRQGPVRAVQSGLISLEEMKKGMYLFGALALISGLVLLYLATQNILIFLLFLTLGLLAIWAAVSYTSGNNPYGYIGLGDISVFLFFGLLAVLGTFFLHGRSFFFPSILIGAALGFFSTAVLNINNIRDIASDLKAGKRSIPVRIGRQAAVRYNWALILGGNLLLLAYCLSTSTYGGLLALGIFPVMAKVGFGVQKATSSEATDPYLKQMALSTLAWVILFGLGLLIF